MSEAGSLLETLPGSEEITFVVGKAKSLKN
jgi:hypothetical protein